MRLILSSVFVVACFRVISGQNLVGRVRSVSSATPTSTYDPARIRSASNKPNLPAEDFSSLLQLAAILSKAQSPPPPPPPPPTPATPQSNALNSGGIIDKLIDALIITATQKNQPPPSSSRLIDVDVLKSLLSLQSSGSLATPASVASSTPVAAQATAAPATISPASSPIPLTTPSTPASSVLEDTGSIVGGNSVDNLSSLSTVLKTLLNPE